LVRVTVSAGATPLADVGERTALAPGMATIQASDLTVTASELVASQYARDLQSPGVAVVVRQGSRLLANNAPAATPGPLLVALPLDLRDLLLEVSEAAPDAPSLDLDLLLAQLADVPLERRGAHFACAAAAVAPGRGHRFAEGTDRLERGQLMLVLLGRQGQNYVNCNGARTLGQSIPRLDGKDDLLLNDLQ